MKVKYCYQCPFCDNNMDNCQLADKEFGTMFGAGETPPEWCPLLKGPVLVEYNPQLYLDL